MIFPKNGAVVIVDDNIKEIEPLIYYFTQKGVPTFVSNGKDSTLPIEPIKGVRLLFLDMELINSNDIRTVTTRLISVLEKIIGIENGPYILIIWSTKNSQYEKDFKDLLLKDSDTVLNPIAIIDLEKEEIFETYNEELFNIDNVASEICTRITDDKNIEIVFDDIQLIKNYIKEELELVNEDDKKAIKPSAIEVVSNEIDAKLADIDSIQIFFEWNNIVSDNDKNLVTDMLELVDFTDVHWNDFIKDTLEEMAAAEQGQSYKQGQTENIKSAFSILNELLLGNISSSLEKKQHCYPNEYKYDKSLLHNITDLGQVTVSKNKLLLKNISLTDKEYYTLLVDHHKKDTLIDTLGNYTDPNAPDVIKAKLFKFKETLINKKAKVNTKLFFTENISAIKPGAIISINDGTLKKNVLLDLIQFSNAIKCFDFETEYKAKIIGLDDSSLDELKVEYKNKIADEIINETDLVKLELTPPCDYSQKNMISNRWLTGIKIPSKYMHLDILNVNYKYDNTGKYYTTKDYFNEGIFTLIFDKRRFHVTDIGNHNELSIKMMMRGAVLNDIRDSVASHIGRKGILNL